MINIVLVDDHEVIRTALRHLLDGANDIQVIGEASSGKEAVNQVRKLKPDVVLLDIEMPEMDGIETAKKLLQIQPGLKIIGLTAGGEDATPILFLQTGAVGYLTKNSSLDKMLAAIYKVNSGQRYLDPQIAQEMVLKHVIDNKPALIDLSARELEVMTLIAKSLSVAKIADQLQLNIKTVHTYRSRIFEKLKVDNDVAMTRFAIKHGLLS